MASSVLIAFTTKHGSTEEVARAIAEALRRPGTSADVRRAKDVRDLEGYDMVVVGAPLYMGRWRREAVSFLRRHRRALTELPTAVFALGPVGDSEESREEPQRQLDRALAKVPDVEPASVALFGGVIDPAKLRFPFNRMPAGDWRDWDAIRAWGEELASLSAGRESGSVRS